MQIGPKFFVEPRVTPGKVYGWSNFQEFASNKIRDFLFVFILHCIQRENVYEWNEDGREAPLKPNIYDV